MDTIAAALKLGATEREVAAAAHGAMMAAGGDAAASPMNFVSGERTCYAHSLPSDRVLKQGDFMHIEFGGQYKRYCSTIARHFNMGAPSKRALEIHKAAHDASVAAMRKVKPGVRGWKPSRSCVKPASSSSICTRQATVSRPVSHRRGARTSTCSMAAKISSKRTWCCRSSRRCSFTPSASAAV
ncbi:MAG: aminopeptidase P family protein [Rhizobiales bacterium]|nr:aminopeptidase P family protein [Hyphomicrobiales bacterium]